MTRAVLSIGTNLGDRLGNLQSVLDTLGPRVISVSPVYSTAPWGGVDQPDFYNATLIADAPGLDEWGWLRLGQDLEARAHRVREVRWGPRTLDVDVITCARDGVQIVSQDPELLLPHPRARERAFVLRPWLDVDRDAVLGGDSVAALLAALPARERDGVAQVAERLAIANV
ncbi:2-amino-4-hydroxy-6-hydroxymethyldihydropteridine diphosphokinase [Tomitella biformata]|uniref:2-amino-4-hydroxy-6- hydroxymethyldihydropteridine diphosphokinase n=1 Tax=Tomitella biformata TaxID=630403 RepID=UPI0004653AAE|nr:2-amino-4-hydroxy-6-hydroxymethyldihydropteridine diphosphokinase [Tomitella biformata]